MRPFSRRSHSHKHKRRSTLRTPRDTVAPTTFMGIQKWHNHLYEHLGWMVLAKDHGYNDKVAVYKHSIVRLKAAIEQKLAGIHDLDRKDDLMILHRNVLVLMEHVNKDFH